MDLIESLFETIGAPDPWGSIINPIWAAHLTDVEEAWDPLRIPAPFPLSQRSRPLANSLVSLPPEEPPENVLVPPPPDEPPEHVQVSPQMKALPETVLVAPVLHDERFSGPERVQLGSACNTAGTCGVAG